MSRSLDERHNHLPPAAASGYLHRVVGATLSRRGFDGAEAGALSEMERLLELRESELRELYVDLHAAPSLDPQNAH